MLSMKALQNWPMIMPPPKVLKARVNKHMLTDYLKRLTEDHDDRNYDEPLYKTCLEYRLPTWVEEMKECNSYLHHLKSSEDGKFFSQGYYQARKLEENIKKFGESNHPNFYWNKFYQQALKTVEKEFSSASLTPLSYSSDEDIVEAIPRLDTNGGYECYYYGISTVKGENLDDIYKRWTWAMDRFKDAGKLDICVVPAMRTQGKGHAFDETGKKTYDCDHKTRAVLMITLSVIILECKWARPFQKWIATIPWYAGGKDLDHALYSRITDMKSKFDHWISIDYSGFDSSISDWLIKDAFNLVKRAFNSIGDDTLYQLMVEQFISKRIILPSGGEVQSNKGVPSGSMWTQIIDSIVNHLMILTYMYSKGFSDNWFDMLIMGDDNLCYTKSLIDMDDLAHYLNHNFGVTINAAKSSVGESSDPPEFLSAVWTPSGRYREEHELLAKMWYPERKRYYNKDTSPEEVFWAYCLAYPAAMRRIFDIQKFINHNPAVVGKTSLVDNKVSRHIPGIIGYQYRYDLISPKSSGFLFFAA